MPWQDVMETALDRLNAGLGPRGQWPGWVFPDAAPGRGRRDISPPLTALGMLALQGLDLPGIDHILERSREHVEKSILPGGLWRYYANIPPDTDDTAMCALALGLEHPLVKGHTGPSLEATRLPDGRFPTWFESGWSPVIDPVPNAHVVAVIGASSSTDKAVAWLLDVVNQGREVAESSYYPDPLDLHLALTRALDAGVDALRPAVETAAYRALERLAAPDLSPYRLAQAIIVAAKAGNPQMDRLMEASSRLAGCVQPAGGWSADTLYLAGNTEQPGYWHYQSWAVVTALCLRALYLVVASVSEPIRQKAPAGVAVPGRNLPEPCIRPEGR